MDRYDKMTREELLRELRLLSFRRKVTPHFLFNSISVAVSLVTKSPKTAVLFLRHLATMYRYLLTYGDKYAVPIEQELEMMQQYFYLMSMRHVGTISLNITPETKKLKKHPLPPLSLQGLLENAIKHNTHTKDEPLEINIYVEHGDEGSDNKDNNSFLCISNNIKPLTSELHSTKIGLAYVSETMRQLYNRDIVIENNGKTFCVRIPLIG